jgi:hypothetical protein
MGDAVVEVFERRVDRPGLVAPLDHGKGGGVSHVGP